MLAEELSELLGQPVNPNRENVLVRCPMHDDRTPSMSINLRKGVFYCWGCGKAGGLRTLAKFLGGELDDADLAIGSVRYEPEPDPVDFMPKLKEFGVDRKVISDYIVAKDIDWPTVHHFNFKTDDRGNLVMPYFDGDRVVGLRYRALDGAKWYESGSERIIYNVNEVRGQKQVILCEGESDTHAMWTYMDRTWGTGLGLSIAVGGVPGAMSSVDTWELYGLDLLWAERVLIAFDNDDAGRKGFERAQTVLGSKAEPLFPPEEFNDWSDAIRGGASVLV